MKEHFRPTASMRSTYPWGYMVMVMTAALGVDLLVPRTDAGILTWIVTFAFYMVLYTGLMRLGAEHYRYTRYRAAKKTYEHYVKLNDEIGM